MILDFEPLKFAKHGVPVRDSVANPADTVRARNRPGGARLLHPLAGHQETVPAGVIAWQDIRSLALAVLCESTAATNRNWKERTHSACRTTLGISVGARTRLAPIEKLQAARTTPIDRRAYQRLDQRQWILRKPVHFVAFLKPLHGVGAAADAVGMPGKQEAAVGVEGAMIGACPAVAVRALIHIGPHQFFERPSMNANEALSAMMTGQHSIRR